MIEANNISVQKGKKLILNDVNLQAHPQQILAIIGANGSGKSTLIKCIAGYEKPSQGIVQYNGIPVSKFSQLELAKIRGLLSQQTYISYPITALDVVVMGRFPYLKEEREQQSRQIARDILEELGMEDFMDRDVRTLSGGERQKVHFARVVAQVTHHPKTLDGFILLDEPLTGLDLAQQHFILAQTQKLSQNGLGVVMVLHDLNLVAQYAEQVVLLHQQKVLAHGTASQVITPQNIHTAYGIQTQVELHPISAAPLITAGHFEMK